MSRFGAFAFQTESIVPGTKTARMGDDPETDAQVRVVCECVGCSSKTHENGACSADFKINGNRWERRTWVDHIDRFLCPECWQDIAANQSPPPGLVT